MIKLHDLEVTYGQFVAVKNLNIHVEKGEFFTMLGPSGCGKTTTLRAIAGFIQPSKGTINLNNRDVTLLKPEERNFGIVFQNYALFPHMTVYENIAFGLRVRREKNKVVQEKVEKYAEMVGVKDHLQKRVTALSGGQQQRVAIARALILEPEILLMDEPLSNLDAKLRIAMREELRRLQHSLGITTVYVTHDQEEALIISDRIAVFENGVIEQIGKPEEIYSSPQTESVCRFVGESNTLTDEFIITLKQAHEGCNLELGYTSYIRKERIKLIKKLTQKAPDTIAVKGSVAHVTYSGMSVTYRVMSSGSALEVVMLDNQNTQFTVGEEVILELDPKHILQFRRRV